MTRFRCRREHCDGLAATYNGLCAYHASPPDLDLAADDVRDADYFRPFDDDIAAMSAQELYLHPECQ